MSDGKSFLVDTTRCTACRGCQVACKQWNGLPGTKTTQRGTYQNPEDTSAETWRLVRFSEGRKEDGKPYWYFFTDACRHCIAPPCKMVGDGTDETAIVQDDATGAVLFTEKTKGLPFEDVRASCPYDIPRQDAATKVMRKCTMCFDRLGAGMIPACAQSCPTGALVFGDRDEILKQAEARVAALKKSYPKAMAVDPTDVRVIFIVTDDPKKYHKSAAA
jgi:formate dehydrogenase iron-sulfur subunit